MPGGGAGQRLLRPPADPAALHRPEVDHQEHNEAVARGTIFRGPGDSAEPRGDLRRGRGCGPLPSQDREASQEDLSREGLSNTRFVKRFFLTTEPSK